MTLILYSCLICYHNTAILGIYSFGRLSKILKSSWVLHSISALAHINPWSHPICYLSGPCSLKGISAVTECRSSSIRVSWLTQSGSSILVVTAEGQDLSFLECNSTGTSCVLNGARCGMKYAIIVSTSSDKCNSLRSPPYYLQTGTVHTQIHAHTQSNAIIEIQQCFTE